jgi:pimeloyl-ACP methyl ester carboxylesterase
MSGSFKSNPIVTLIGVSIGALLATAIAAGLASTLTAALAGVFGGGVIGLGAFLLKDEPELAKAATRLGDTFKRTFATAAGAMLMPLVGALNIFSASILRMQPTIDTIFRTLAPAILPLAEGLAGFLENLGPGLEALAQVGADVLIDLGKNLPGWGRALGNFFILIRDNWPEIKKNLESFFRDLGKALKFLAGAFLWLSMEYDKMKARLKQAIMPPGLTLAISLLHSKWATDFKNLVGTVGRSIGTIVSFFMGLPGRAAGATSSLWGRIRGAFRIAGSGMRINAIAMVAGFVRILATIVNRSFGAIRPLPGRIKGFFAGAGRWLWSAGANLVGGLVSGMASRMGALWGKVQEVKNAVTQFLSNAWQIRSPSRVMEGMGENLVRGLEIGLDKRMLPLKKRMVGVSAGIPQVVTESAPKQYMSTSTQTSTFHIPVTVHAGAGADGAKIGRDAAREIRKALDDYDRSVKK